MSQKLSHAFPITTEWAISGNVHTQIPHRTVCVPEYRFLWTFFLLQQQQLPVARMPFLRSLYKPATVKKIYEKQEAIVSVKWVETREHIRTVDKHSVV